jgi:predicted transcriptional regulator
MTMTLAEIGDVLECEVLTGENGLSVDIETVVASDGMSEILAFATPGALMITGLTNIQSVRTADIAHACAIIYIRGKRPDERGIALAQMNGMPVLTTRLGMFDVCGILREHGLKGAT